MIAYIYRADIYCSTCAGEIQKDLDKRGGAGGRSIVVASYPVCWSGDSELYPNGPHSNGGGEADTPQHCGQCGVFLENPLTQDGDAYVRQAAAEFEREGADESWEEIARRAETSGAPAVAEWIRFYLAEGQ